MACNTCAKSYSLFRKEKACPGCGFGYCSKCLDHKIFVEKSQLEAKVCVNCARTQNNENKNIRPPDVYYKRTVITSNIEPGTSNPNLSFNIRVTNNPTDQNILERLNKLKEEKKNVVPTLTTDEEIQQRLNNIKIVLPSASTDDIQERLSKLKGVPIIQIKQTVPPPNMKSDQEQADDLLKQYMEQSAIESKYKEEFDGVIDDIESRLTKLKNSEGSSETSDGTKATLPVRIYESEDEEETVQKIIKKIKAESSLKDELTAVRLASSRTVDELPFCEICNEDAKMRCLGCSYLFCKRCFLEHKDDDDGCNQYENYTPNLND